MLLRKRPKLEHVQSVELIIETCAVFLSRLWACDFNSGELCWLCQRLLVS